MPLLTQAAVDGVAVDIRSANTAAAAWCAEVNAMVHFEISAIPNERLIAERELLQPLPSLRMQIGTSSVLREVDRLSCVRYGSARYSVPTRLIGATVAVVVDHGAVCLIEPATGMIVESMNSSPLAAHPSWTPITTGPARHRVADPVRRPAWRSSSATSAKTPKHSWSAPPRSGTTRSGSELEILLALGAAHGTDALVSALHRAGAFRRFRATDVRSILAASTGTPQPRPAGNAPILDLPVAPTRPLDAYRITPVVDGEATS